LNASHRPARGLPARVGVDERYEVLIETILVNLAKRSSDCQKKRTKDRPLRRCKIALIFVMNSFFFATSSWLCASIEWY